MRTSIIAFAACTGLTLAQNNTIELFWPYGAIQEDLTATVQSANASATLFHIACPTPGISQYNIYNCDSHAGFDYTIVNTSTYQATMVGDTYALTRTCVSKGQQRVACGAEGHDDDISSQFFASEEWGEDATNMLAATVVSGADKLSATYSASSSTPSASSQSPTAGSSATPGSHADATAAVSTSDGPQATSGAGISQARGSALLALPGVGAAMLFALTT